MKKASKEFEQAFWDGIKQDRDMHKRSQRLLKMLAANEGDIKKTVAQIVMAPKIQTGLKWAADNDVLQRSLEALVIQFNDDFDDVPNIDKVAKWRLELVAR